MAPKGQFKYNPGDKLGPKKILFIERTTKMANGAWRGYFQCPICERTDWEVSLSKITTGESQSCGCDRTKYKEGTRIGPNDILFIKRLEQIPNGKSYYGLFECPFDGREFKSRIDYVASGHTSSCGCLRSKGESLIHDLLKKLNISFEREYTFNDCVNPNSLRKLRFDFYLPDYNCCIEYDGKQHQLGWLKTDSEEGNPEYYQYRDNIKTNFCEKNNIKLIRIPYTDFNILDKEYILKRLEE